MSVINRRKPYAERNQNFYGYPRRSQSYPIEKSCTEYNRPAAWEFETEIEPICLTTAFETLQKATHKGKEIQQLKNEAEKERNILNTKVESLRKATIEKEKEIQLLKDEAEKEGIILNTIVESLRKATIEKEKEIQLLKNEGEKERVMLSSTVESLRNDTIEKEQEIQQLKNEAEKEGIILKTIVESLRKATIENEKEIQLLKNEGEKERIMLSSTVESLRNDTIEKEQEIQQLELDKKDLKTKYDKLLLKFADTQSDMWKMKKVAERNCKLYQRSTTSSDIETLKKYLEFEKAKKEKNKKAHVSSHRRVKTITSTLKCYFSLEDQSEEHISTSADSSSSDEYPVSPDESDFSRHVVKRKKNSGSEFAGKSVVNVTNVTAQEVNFIKHSKVEFESDPDMDERLPAIED